MGLPLRFVVMLGSHVPSNITNVPIQPRRFTTWGGHDTNPNYDLYKDVFYTSPADVKRKDSKGKAETFVNTVEAGAMLIWSRFGKKKNPTSDVLTIEGPGLTSEFLDVLTDLQTSSSLPFRQFVTGSVTTLPSDFPFVVGDHLVPIIPTKRDVQRQRATFGDLADNEQVYGVRIKGQTC